MRIPTQKRIGKILLWIGILAWLPYMYLKFAAGQEVPITPYLTVHLTGVLGSILARVSIWLTKRQQRKDTDAIVAESEY